MVTGQSKRLVVQNVAMRQVSLTALTYCHVNCHYAIASRLSTTNDEQSAHHTPQSTDSKGKGKVIPLQAYGAQRVLGG
jgi:hypothetical protein